MANDRQMLGKCMDLNSYCMFELFDATDKKQTEALVPP